MATLSIRKQGESPGAIAPKTRDPRWEPFRMMRDLLSWDPFREMAPLAPVQSEFDPTFEVKETKDAYVFKADVPGVKESDIDVSLTGSRLTISGKREEERREQTDTYYTYERTYGDFSRAFTLPDGVDLNGVGAEMKDGVLTINVKKLPETQPKKIAIQGEAASKVKS
jgi:HSP20 family protein